MLYFASQRIVLKKDSKKIAKTSEEIRNFFSADFFFSDFASFLVKYKNMRLRKMRLI